MIQLWQDANLPAGVINLVQGGRDTGIALARPTGIDGLLFTGSAETGKAIHGAFAGHPEMILALEMGGNNPLILWDVEDLESAAYVTVLSAFITAGQRCSCARRLILSEGEEGDRFLDRLLSTMEKIRVGPFTDYPEPFMGPVISEQAAEELLTAQKRFAESGGKILAEMKPVRNIGSLLLPGLIDVTDVPDRPDEELFGPLLQVIRVPDFRTALNEANNTRYGLSAGLLSDNRELYARFSRQIRAGVRHLC